MSDENQLTLIDDAREIEQFDPERHAVKIGALDFSIRQAKKIRDWPALEKAVDAKIEEQHKFVAWWSGTVERKGGDRKSKNQKSRPRFLKCVEAERLTGMKQPRVSELGKRLRSPDKYRADLLGVVYIAAFLSALDNVRGTGGTGENEWFTPPEYIALARTVLGEIDLDPATHEAAQATIKAARYFTKADDGLVQEWHGRVWLNPPYAQPLIEQFVMKLLAEYDAGRVTSAIMLTHNYTDTVWFQAALGAAYAICFTRGRVKFYEPDGEIAAPTQGQAFFYFGDDADKFLRTFRNVGSAAVWDRIEYAQGHEGMDTRTAR